MMKFIFLLLLLLFYTTVYCQSSTIEIHRVFGGYEYKKNGEKLNDKELLSAFDLFPPILNQAKSSRRKKLYSNAFVLSGGFLVGYYLANQINSRSENDQTNLLITGSSLISISIPFSILSAKKMKSAVEHYNKRNN